MVKLRLTRTGRKHVASYRIVAVHNREKRETDFLDILGHYDPHNKEHKYKIDTEKAKYWLGVGAQPTPTVKRFLIKEGLIEKPKHKKVYKKKPGRKAQERAEAVADAEAKK